jgi:hypothetical protein
MIRVFIRKGILGTDGRELFDIPHRPGLSARALAHEFAKLLPKSVPIEAVVNGRLLKDDQLDAELGEHDNVILVPVTSGAIAIGPLIVSALIAATVSFAVNYVISLLLPRPKPPGVPTERGDQTSATYAWDGITTNYGQGFPVPFVYGRHAVGGQVIFTDLFSTTASAAPADKLRVVLALCEGPIHAIGDTAAEELDGLGTLAAPLPSNIRIDNNLLDNTDTSTVVRLLLLAAPWTGPTPTGAGDTLHVYDSTGTALQGTVQIVTANNAQKTNLDCIVLTGLLTLGAPGNIVRNLNAATIGQATLASASNQTRFNNDPGALAWIRPGELDQSSLPGTTFRGSSKTFSPNAQLAEAGEEAQYSYFGTERLTTVGFVMAFPGGLYTADATGGQLAYTVRFNVTWRPQGTTTWRNFYRPQGNGALLTPRTITANTVAQLLDTFGGDLTRPGDPAVSGPLDIRVQRESPSGGIDTVSAALWRNVFFNTEHTLTYPRVALLGLELSAGARFQGGIPNINVRIDGKTIRVWDAVDGWSPRCWDIPAAPFDFMAHAPGRNPAWILLDLLLAPWGLGRYLTEDDIDLPAFRRWAAFCDSDPSPSDPWNTAAFCADVVGDVIRPAQEWILLICAAGRAAPVDADGKISIVYHYRDAHGDAGISIAAKTVTQLFTSGNTENLQLTWLSKAGRFTVHNYEFLDEDQSYLQSKCVVPDVEGALDNPASLNPDYWRPQTIQAYGVTRRAQLWREGMFAHRVTRLVRREVTFRTGPWALAATVGDLIGVEHEIMRPFSTDVPLNMAVVSDATASNTVVVDHDATGATAISIRGPDGAPIERAISGIVVTAGSSTLTLTGAAVTVDAGATCVVGLADKLTQPYEVVAISLQEDMKREVRAIQWDPAVYDELTPTDYANNDTETTPDDLLRQADDSDHADLDGLRATRARGGATSLSWSRPANRAGAPVRVFVRDDDRATWALLGETAGSSFDWHGASPGRTYRVAATMELVTGGWPLPEDSAQTTFVAEEFAPFQPQPLSALAGTDTGDAVVLTWDRQATQDVAGYEGRTGTCWTAGKLLFDAAASVHRLEPAPLGGTLLIAARSASGLYGQPVTLALPDWRPRGTVQAATFNDFSGTPAGVHSGTAYADGAISLQAGVLSGTYTGPELDLTYEAEAWWQVSTDQREIDERTVDEEDFMLDSGEARWTTCNGRPASPARPAGDWDLTIDDAPWLIDDVPGNLRVHGELGEPGSNTQVLIESRWYTGGAWGSWEAHTDRWRAASKMQTRATLRRDSEQHEPALTGLRAAVNL